MCHVAVDIYVSVFLPCSVMRFFMVPRHLLEVEPTLTYNKQFLRMRALPGVDEAVEASYVIQGVRTCTGV